MTLHHSVKTDTMLREMLALIGGYSAESSLIGPTVRGLKSRFATIDDLDAQWSEDFLSAWGGLEIVNAMILDDAEVNCLSVPRVSDQQKKWIRRYLAELEDLIRKHLID